MSKWFKWFVCGEEVNARVTDSLKGVKRGSPIRTSSICYLRRRLRGELLGLFFIPARG